MATTNDYLGGDRDEHNHRRMRDVLGYINSMELAHLARFHCRFKGKSSLSQTQLLKLIFLCKSSNP